MNIEASQDNSESMTIGKCLRKARKQLGLSQQEIAERLCLKKSTVRDIEEDNISDDLASTFARGYIRSYAKLVHIPEEELLLTLTEQATQKIAKVAPIHSFSLGKHHKKREGFLMTLTWLMVLLVLSLTGLWWWQNHKAQQEEIATIAAGSIVKVARSSVRLKALNKNQVNNITNILQVNNATAPLMVKKLMLIYSGSNIISQNKTKLIKLRR